MSYGEGLKKKRNVNGVSNERCTVISEDFIMFDSSLKSKRSTCKIFEQDTFWRLVN